MNFVKVKYILLVTFFSFLCVTLWSQNATRSSVDGLRKDMYRYYNTTDSKSFFDTTAKLKSLTLKSDVHTFYKTWGNEALYAATHGQRSKGSLMVKSISDYAKSHNSTYGMYISTSVMASILALQGNFQLSREYRLKAIDYCHRYFPDESAASNYLELAKTDYTLHPEQALQYCDMALCEKHLEPLHELNAWSLKCLISYITESQRVHFREFYEQRKKAVAKLGHEDNFYYEVEIDKSLLDHDQKRAGFFVDKIKNSLSRVHLQSLIAAEFNDYESAYYFLTDYHILMDSVSNENQRNSLTSYLADLDLARTENEAKELKLANQSLLLQHMKSRLEQHRLQSLTKDLQLKNSNMELVRRASQIRNSYLESQTKDLKIQRYKSEIRNRELQQHGRLIIFGLIIFLIVIIVGGLVFSLLRRNHFIRHLTVKNAELLRAKTELEHAQVEAMKANEVKQAFLNNISHEIRTPLNSIDGFSQILTSSGISFTEEEKNEITSRIKESSEILTNIIDNMIRLSYYESLAEISLDEEFLVNELLMDSIDGVRPRLHTGVSISLDSDARSNSVLHTNRRAVAIILEQLLDNAVKFTSQGSITVKCVMTATESGHASIQVTDTGCGISEDRQKEIFELFTDTHEQVKTTGIGLSLCQTICQLIHATLSYDSSYKQGTRFILTI